MSRCAFLYAAPALRARTLSARFTRSNSSLPLPPPPTPAPQHRGFRRSALLLGAAILSGGAYTLGSLYPPDLLTYLSPRTAPLPPGPHTPAALAHAGNLEAQIHKLKPLHELRARADAAEWYETRPYVHVPEERRVNALTAGALRGPGMLAIPPLVRARNDEQEAWVFVHLGTRVCGHEGLVHGGLLATLLDESLGRISILNLPERVGVTANLNLNYRAPTKANQFVVIKTRVLSQSGRKITVEGKIEDMEGTLLAEATALFIQPRYANLINTTALVQYVGARDPPPPPASAVPEIRL